MIFPRFYPILDTNLAAQRGMPLADLSRVLLDGGARILQLRHKGQYTRDVFLQAESIARLCRDSGVTFIVNDRADVARMLDAGVHVGQDDLAPHNTRQIIGPSTMLGFSTHNEEQFRAALSEPVDYLAFGPMYSTTSKQNSDPVVSLETLESLRPLTRHPIIAIGGITRSRAREVLAHGADCIAVIADVYPDPLTAVSLRQRVRDWLSIIA